MQFQTTIRKTAATAAVAALLATLSPVLAEDRAMPTPKNGYSIDLAFINHLDAQLIEQDVYVEREPGSGDVYRVTTGFHDMNAPVYTTAVKVPHDPFDMSKLGPYPRGKALEMTMGDWLRAQGTGRYTCTDGVGTLDTSFTNLVPKGVYTMWHAFIALPPTEPFSGTLDLPLGARDGSESSFVADADGNASFVHTFRPCLEMSDVWTTSMLAINYHSDGKTYGAYPGDFGLNAHIPLFVMLPPREGIQ